jgi:large subunit ribosomal protein L4
VSTPETTTARRSGYSAGEARRLARLEAHATAAGETRSVPVHTPTGGTDGTAELPGELFDAPANTALMHQVVTAQLAAARQGTHDTKTRGEVRGGGKKPYRQKGTGRARQGSVRAPQFAGGGTVHGPTPRDYDQRTPKKMKAAALRGALSDRARHERIHVFSTLVDGTAPSTKGARTALEGVVAPSREHRRVLAVIARDDEAGRRSVANLPAVHQLTPDQLNTYDVLRADDVVFTTAALEAFVASRAARAQEVEK